jgi:hypothetical protein
VLLGKLSGAWPLRWASVLRSPQQYSGSLKSTSYPAYQAVCPDRRKSDWDYQRQIFYPLSRPLASTLQHRHLKVVSIMADSNKRDRPTMDTDPEASDQVTLNRNITPTPRNGLTLNSDMERPGKKNRLTKDEKSNSSDSGSEKCSRNNASARH